MFDSTEEENWDRGVAGIEKCVAVKDPLNYRFWGGHIHVLKMLGLQAVIGGYSWTAQRVSYGCGLFI